MFATALVSGTTAEDISSPMTEMTAIEVETSTNSKNAENQPLTTQDQVTEYFSDIPILAEVAYCESRYRQFDQNGNVLRGIQNPADVGVMQINEKYHATTAVKFGFNLYTLEGNMAYARFLYEKEGTRPWKYSSSCWGTSEREVALK